MMWSIGRKNQKPLRRARGFTLIELVLIMALLTIVISLVTPSVIRFMGGRALDSELRRMVSLTRYGQSRATSEGIPTVLWVDPKAGTYGLRQEAGYTENDSKAVDYKLAENLQIDVDQGKSKGPSTGKLLGIHFSPDGSVIASSSVAGISLKEAGHQPVWIVPTLTGLSYEVKN